jgi:hypothetical protein
MNGAWMRDAEAWEQAPVKHVRLLSLGFFCVFSAYMSSELMQTTVNGRDGFLCIFIVYTCLVVSSICAPGIVHRLGPRRVLWASSISYGVITASYLLPDNRAFLALACVSVGLSAGALWNAQSCYLAACTKVLSLRSGQEYTDVASRLNASFYRIFSGTCACACVCICVCVCCNTTYTYIIIPAHTYLQTTYICTYIHMHIYINCIHIHSQHLHT